MKKVFITLTLCALVLFSVMGQENYYKYDNYIRVAGNIGLSASTEHNEKIGIGGEITWLTGDNLFLLNRNNFMTLGIKGFNNPYGEGKYVSSIMNGEGDAFNYIMALVGYRVTKLGAGQGFFIEPRTGVAFGSNYSAFAFSPLAGYSYNNIEFSIYCDMGFSSKRNALRKTNFFTPGVSLAYNFKL